MLFNKKKGGRKMKKIALFLVFAVTLFSNVSVFAQEEISLPNVETIDRGEYVEVIEDGVINTIHDNIIGSKRIIEVRDEFGSVTNRFEANLDNGQMSVDGVVLDVKASVENFSNIATLRSYGDGTEDNPYRFCNPGESRGYKSYDITAYELAGHVGEAANYAAVASYIAIKAGVAVAAITFSISGSISLLSWAIQKFGFTKNVGISFWTREVCSYQREFDAGEYVYFYGYMFDVFDDYVYY